MDVIVLLIYLQNGDRMPAYVPTMEICHDAMAAASRGQLIVGRDGRPSERAVRAECHLLTLSAPALGGPSS